MTQPRKEEVESFFFKAMMDGYAAQGSKKTKVVDMPGYKEIRFQDGEFLLVDRWCVNPLSPKSAGTTTIWIQEFPVWVMNYGGFYEESVIALLKHVLRNTYEAHQFIGGRGPILYEEGDLVYMNHPDHNEFAEFDGDEEIFDVKGTSFGYHKYWGMKLF